MHHATGGAGRARPWLSVVMPTFNGAAFIQRALDSVVAAGDAGLECIVVDDGSTDATLDIVASYRTALRVRVADGVGAGNWVASSNVGIAAAEGDYLTFLHQDDEWLPGRVDAARDLIHRSSGASLYVHAARFLSASGRSLGDWTLPFRGSGGIVDGDDFIERLLVQNFVCIGAPLFRRSDLLATGALDEQLWYTADWDLWLRLAARGRVAYDSRPLVGFRVHGGSQTVTRSADIDAIGRQLDMVFERHFERWAETRPRAVAGAVARAARASIECNVALAAVSHRMVPPWAVVTTLAALARGGAGRFARDAGLHQRVGSRLRAMAARDGWRVSVR